MPSETATSASDINNVSLWTWAHHTITGNSDKPVPIEGHHMVLVYITIAYILGTVASSVLSTALLALIIACAACVVCAACATYAMSNLNKPFAVTSAFAQGAVQESRASNAARTTCNPAPIKPDQDLRFRLVLDRNSYESLPESSDTNAQNSRIIHFSQQCKMEEAHRAIESMRAQGKKPKLVAYSCFLNACAKRVQVEEAERCLAYMREDGIELNSICFSTIINVYASAGDLDKAEEFFSKMATVGGEVVPNSSAYNVLIKASAKVHQIERAEAWFDKMKAAGVQPTVITFTTLINACAQMRDAERAEKWLSMMSDYNVDANLMTHNSMINVFSKMGDVQRAERCFERMKNECISPDVVTYNSLVNACKQAGDMDRAAHWVDKMLQEGLDPDHVTFSTCIWEMRGDITAAKRWLTKMLECGVELNAVNYNALIHTGVKAGDLEFSECLLQHKSCSNVCIYPITYRAFIHALAKGNQSERAMEWLEKMVRVHGMTLITTDEMFGPVISAFCNCQNSAAVLDWIQKMRQWNIPISKTIYSKAIKALQQSPNKQAYELSQEMLKNLASNSSTPNVVLPNA